MNTKLILTIIILLLTASFATSTHYYFFEKTTPLTQCQSDLRICNIKKSYCQDLKQFDDYFKGLLNRNGMKAGLYSKNGDTGAIYLMTTNRTPKQICETFIHELGHAQDKNNNGEEARQNTADAFAKNNAWRCEGLQ